MLSHQLCKDDLRLLLAEKNQPTLQASKLSPLNHQKAVEWATEARLLDEQGLTPEGRLIVVKDPYLETAVTDWLIHLNLSQGNSLWRYFVHEFLFENPTFYRDELLIACQKKFALDLTTLEKQVDVILGSYLNQNSIEKTRFISKVEGLYSIGQSDLSNPYTVGYLLAKVWETEFGTQSTVLINQILEAHIKISSILGTSYEQLDKQIEFLEMAEIVELYSMSSRSSPIKQRRRKDKTSVYQVYRCWNESIELLVKAYDNDMETPNKPLIQVLEDFLDNDVPDFSQFLEWATQLTVLDGSFEEPFRFAS